MMGDIDEEDRMRDYKRALKGLEKKYGNYIKGAESFSKYFKKYFGENEDLEDKLLYISMGENKFSEESINEAFEDFEKKEKKEKSRRRKKTEKARRIKKFKFFGKQKNRVVKARKIFVKTKYGKKQRFIGANGRYTRVKQ